MTKAQRTARAHEIVVAVLAWLADVPDEMVQDQDDLAGVTDPAWVQTAATEIAQGLRLMEGEEANLYAGLANEKWDTVGDLAGAMAKIVENRFDSGGQSPQ